jgi:2-oxoglutarate dehydrogenase E2 component (dihydrolipoamide succinyltransferase)
MAIHQVQMPQLGETVAEGTLIAWLKSPGDEVVAGEVIAEIATDKVDTEIESNCSGVFVRTLVEPGEVVDVGTVLAEIESDADAPGQPDQGDSAVTEAAPKAVPSQPAEAAAPPATPPLARSETDGREETRLSPLVRRLLAENEVSAEELTAFAAGQRIDRKMVDAFLAQRDGAPAARPSATPAAPISGAGLVPFTRIRSTIARRMVDSLQTSPHVATAIEVNLESVARSRELHNHQSPFPLGTKLTWLPFVVAAVARTLRDFPLLNGSVVEGGVMVHDTIDIGVAVDLAGSGLVVPVLRGADSSSLGDIAVGIADLAGRARSGSLSPGEASGSTFTVSAQGPHGTLFTTAIINQPEVGILSVDGIARRPVVVELDNGTSAIAANYTCVLTLSWDHRAIDGLYAGGFLAALRDDLQGSDWQREAGL